ISSSAEVTCEGEDLINVDILIGHSGIVSPFKPGHILVFRCSGVNLKMFGQRAIECLSSGKWDNPYPKCGASTCSLNTTVEDLTIERIPDIQGPAKSGHKLIFSCNGQGLKLKGEKEITCQSKGERSSPFPKCEEVTCVANLPANMRSDRDLGREVSVRPGETITLSCDQEGQELLGQRQISCLASGEWNAPFPKCVKGLTKKGVKREKHPVCGSPVGENALLRLEVRGERAD
ncbi:P-selectin-like, partial [Pseudorasbora parva]|uniref:P-selectin-like n=1 Tax=Pseudorasbora parva TaxID=51549 RepID=UPI00351F76F6